MGQEPDLILGESDEPVLEASRRLSGMRTRIEEAKALAGIASKRSTAPWITSMQEVGLSGSPGQMLEQAVLMLRQENVALEEIATAEDELLIAIERVEHSIGEQDSPLVVGVILVLFVLALITLLSFYL